MDWIVHEVGKSRTRLSGFHFLPLRPSIRSACLPGPRYSPGMIFAQASEVAQTVKRLPAMRETQVQFLGQEDPLKKEMAMQSSTLAWKIPWTEEPDRLQSMGSQRVRHN